MDIEELRSLIREARKEFLEGKLIITDEKISLVHITQILTYVDLSVDSYRNLIRDHKAEVEKLLGCDEPSEELISLGIAERRSVIMPKNSLVIQAAREAGIEICDLRRDPRNQAVLDLVYALESLRIPVEAKIIEGDLKIRVKGKEIRTVITGITQPDKAYGRSGEDIIKLRLYVPRFLSGSLGRKLLPIIIDLGLAEILKNVPIIYLPLGILSLLAFYREGIPAVSVYTPVYKKIQSLISR